MRVNKFWGEVAYRLEESNENVGVNTMQCVGIKVLEGLQLKYHSVCGTIPNGLFATLFMTSLWLKSFYLLQLIVDHIEYIVKYTPIDENYSNTYFYSMKFQEFCLWSLIGSSLDPSQKECWFN